MKKLMLVTIALFSLTQLQAQGFKNAERKKENAPTHSNLGNNILSFYPFLVVTTSSNESTPELTVGAAYEGILTNKMLGIKIPVFASLRQAYFYTMPTLKIYPFRQGPVRFAVGPQLIVGFGNASYKVVKYDPATTISYTQTISGTRKQFGFLVSPSLNMTLSEHVYLDLESGLGVMYYDNMPYANSNYYSSSYYKDNPINPAFHIGFAAGYRF